MIKKKMVKKVDVIYVRVSSKEQTYNNSLGVQEEICRKYSGKDGHEVLKVFREEGESAKTTKRTRLQEMMRFCEQHKKQVGRVVFYNVSRMSRDTADYLALKFLLKKLDISIISATEAFDDSPAGRLHETILSAFAEFDNNVKAVRTIEGMKARLMKGLWSGIAPWGYRNDLEKKIIVPHSDKAPIVKMLFEKYSTGKYTFKELANMANKMGVRSRHGMKISKQLVAKIIVNPIYYGMLIIPKFEISIFGSHETIISEKLFRQAQDVKNGNIGRKLPRNKDNQEYPLGGIRCDGCGGNISGGKARGKMGKYYQYYGCINSECLKRKSIKKDDLEKDFTSFLTELTPDYSFFEVLKETIRIAHKAELDSVESSGRKINTKVMELKDKKEKLLNLRIEGEIKTDEFILANEDLNSKIKDLESSLSNLYPPELEVESVVDSGIEFLKRLPENWRDLEVKDLRVLRTLLFPQNLIYAYPTIKTPELCCIYNIKPALTDEKTRMVTPRGVEPRLTD